MELLQLTVFGNCEICKQRIETAAMAAKGVLSATWDIKTSRLFITVASGKTTLEKISEAIAKAGHNTEIHEVENEVKSHLTDCCRYMPQIKSAVRTNAY